MGQFAFSDTPISYLLILATVLLSVLGFERQKLRSQFLFNPYLVVHRKEYGRILLHGFIHADWMHLLFNMYVFFNFGCALEWVFSDAETFYNVFGSMMSFWGKTTGRLLFLTLYIGGICAASLPILIKHKNNPGYNSLGASGAVSSVLMAFVLLFPKVELMLLFPPVAMPAVVLGLLFFLYEFYMNKRGGTGVAHDAHLGGATFGLLFMLLLNIDLGARFILQVMSIVPGI